MIKAPESQAISHYLLAPPQTRDTLLGRYQALLLVELDGPRQREVLVRIAADT